MKIVSQHPSPEFRDLKRNSADSFRQLFHNEAHSLHYNLKARGAIQEVLQRLGGSNGDTVLVPAFHCPTVVQPILLAGYKVRFYGVTEDLSIQANDLIQGLDKNVAAILVIHYFGFPADFQAIVEPAKLSNSLIIEDWSHSFIQANPTRLAGNTDNISIYSFWKLSPCLVGGGYLDRQGKLKQPAPSNETSDFKQTLKLTKQVIESCIDQSDNLVLKKLFNGLEAMRKAGKETVPEDEVKPIGPSDNEQSQEEQCVEHDNYPLDLTLFRKAIPGISRRILFNTDIPGLISKRRDNYHYYLSHLDLPRNCKPFFSTLPEDVCPWAFPVRLDGRSEFDYKLKALGVPFFTFGEQLHPLIYKDSSLSKTALEVARYLSNSTLCFSAHQKLGHEEIRAYIPKIHQVLSDHGTD